MQVVDTNALLCPRGTPRRAFGDAPDVRPDGAHFSLLGAYAVASWLMPIVLGARPAPPRIFPDYRSTRRATSASVPAGE